MTFILTKEGFVTGKTTKKTLKKARLVKSELVPKLFVWDDVLTNYNSGLIAVMAYSLTDALVALKKGGAVYTPDGAVDHDRTAILEEVKKHPPVVFSVNQWTFMYGGG